MKAKMAVMLLTLLTSIVPAYADTYVKVDANGNAIGGAIVCDAATCGEGSLYSQLTLKDGERYVLQGSGVSYGIGNNNPNTDVKYTNNEWVITRTEPITNTASVERFTVITPTPVSIPSQTTIETATVIDTATAIIDTATVTIDSATVTSNSSFADVIAQINLLLSKIYALLAILGVK